MMWIRWAARISVLLASFAGVAGLTIPVHALTYDECANPATFNNNEFECVLACQAAVNNPSDPENFIKACASCKVGALLSLSPVLGVAIDNFCTAGAIKLATDLLEQIDEATCDKGPAGCCLREITEGEGDDKRGQLTAETCEGQPPVYFGDCVCIVKKAVAPPISNVSYGECSQKCEAMGGEMDASQGVGRFPTNEDPETRNAQPNINSLCWTPDECQEADGTFTGEHLSCPSGRGRCLAPEPTITLSSPILGQTTVIGMRNYINLLFRFLIGAAIIAATIMFVWAGIRYIIGSTVGSITSAKEIMTNAIIGLVLLLSAVAILRTLNPATVSYNKLDIYMVNSVAFSDDLYCRDYRPRNASAKLLFGDAGEPPGKTPYDKAKFEIPPDDTLCGKEYYAENFIGRRCTGSRCAEKGRVCLSCKGGFEECGERTEGFACISAVIAGNIKWADETAPEKMYLMGICNYLQPAAGQVLNFEKAETNVPVALTVELGDADDKAGTTWFKYAGDTSDLTQLQQACASHGGLRGVALGVQYNDIEGSVAANTAKGFAAGTIVPVAGNTIGAVVGALSGVVVDDIAIITKKDCGNTGTSLLSAYTNGTGSSFDSTDMKAAIYCGARVTPRGNVSTFTSTFYQNNLWSYDELKTAMETGESITCNYGLSVSNAPPDPGTKLMGGCGAGWCPLVESTCND